jgi:hypothetical protein
MQDSMMFLDLLDVIHCICCLNGVAVSLINRATPQWRALMVSYQTYQSQMIQRILPIPHILISSTRHDEHV